MKLPASRVNVKTMSILLGAGRAALGVGYMFAPTLTSRSVIGDEAELPGSRLTYKLFGAREIYLGGVVIAAAQAESHPLLKKLLWSGAAVDAWDASAALTTAGIRGLPRYGVAAVGTTYAALGAYIATQVPDKS